MVFKNLNMANRVCNGSRGILTNYSNRMLEVEFLTKDYARLIIFILKMASQSKNDKNVFKFTI
jgi:hypothetical protein